MKTKKASKATIVGRKLREQGVVPIEEVVEISVGGEPHALPPTTDESQRIAAVERLAQSSVLDNIPRPTYYDFSHVPSRELALRLTRAHYSEEQTLSMLFSIRDRINAQSPD